MDDGRLIRSYLESLTTAELARLADRYGLDVPPGLERIFIIEELLDLEGEGADNSGRAGEIPLRETELREPVRIPKQYNITYIDVLLRDPLWVFAFWEIKTADKDFYEGLADFEGYFLKIVPRGDKKSPPPGKDEPFIISVGPGDSAWYIGFPPSGGRFRVEIGLRRGTEEVALAASRSFTLPKQLNSPGWGNRENAGEPLIQLSGIDDLPVFRNTDRLSRRREGSSSGRSV
ncbi:MAG: DUF4912 domain-containing protein [Spirochaetaceae bacterium]|jgi:hypothetical protein|nr:DUF4912 domain-containing protein [Spirochaetaceae bacterium]